MNLFDIIVVAIGISSTLMGLHSGLIRLTLGFLSFIFSLISTFVLFPIVESAALEHVSNTTVAAIISAVASYIVSMLFFAFVNGRISKILVDLCGGLLDRLLGMVAGVARGLIICSIIFGAVAVFSSDSYVKAATLKDVADRIDSSKYPKWLTSAASYNVIENSASIIGSLIPAKELQKIKMPEPPKHLPTLPEGVVNKAVEAGAKHIIDNQSNSFSYPSPSHTSDDLDAELGELMGQ